MKLAIEIIKREIAQRELAQAHNHLRKEEVQLELDSLNKALERIAMSDFNSSLPYTTEEWQEAIRIKVAHTKFMNELYTNNMSVGSCLCGHTPCICRVPLGNLL